MYSTEKHKYQHHTHTTRPATATIKDNIRDTIRLLEEQLQTPDYTLIRQLGWNLGWLNNIYVETILDDPYYDEQAITFAIQILKDLLEPPTDAQS